MPVPFAFGARGGTASTKQGYCSCLVALSAGHVHNRHTWRFPSQKVPRSYSPAAGSLVTSQQARLQATAGAASQTPGITQTISTGSPATFGKREICIAVDGTEASVAALQWALDNVISAADMVHLVHVISDPRAPQTAVGEMGAGVQWSPMGAADVSQLAQEWRRRLEEQGRQLLMNTFAPMLRQAGIRNEVEVLQQRGAKSAAGIGELLCSKAAALKADMLLVASHGSGVLADFGSVAQYCAKNTPCPLLLLPPAPGSPPEGGSADVLVAAWDDLAGLELATRLTVGLLHHKGSQLSVVLVENSTNSATDDDSGQAVMDDATKQLQAAASAWAPGTRLSSVVISNISTPQAESDYSLVGEQLCSRAVDSGARLLVLKGIGSGFIQELVHGPALSYVLRHSKLPVVLVP